MPADLPIRTGLHIRPSVCATSRFTLSACSACSGRNALLYRGGSASFRKAHTRSVVDLIEVDDTRIRIKGSGTCSKRPFWPAKRSDRVFADEYYVARLEVHRAPSLPNNFANKFKRHTILSAGKCWTLCWRFLVDTEWRFEPMRECQSLWPLWRSAPATHRNSAR